MSRNGWLHLGRALVSACLLAAVAVNIDWSEFKSVFAQVHFGWLWGVFAALVADRFLAAYKLGVLMNAQGVLVRTLDLVMVMLVGMFLGFFLPSSIAIDVMIGYLVYRVVPRGAHIASAIMVDRFMGLSTLVLLGIAGTLALHSDRLPGHSIELSMVAVIVTMGAGVHVLLRDRTADFVEARFAGRDRRLLDIVVKVYRALRQFRQQRKVLGYSFLLSAGQQLVRVAEVYLMARFLGIDVLAVFLCIVVALTTVLVIVPISIGGLGVREGTFASLFALGGYSPADGFALSVGVFALDVLLTLLGGVVALWFRPERLAGTADK